MPLLGKKPYFPVTPPADLKPDEEIFFIGPTNEVFRDYSDYVNKYLLYSSQVWSCQYSGNSRLTYQEALESEQQCLERLKKFPKGLEKTLLQNAHHWTNGFEALVEKCYNSLHCDFTEGDHVIVTMGAKRHNGKVTKVHHEKENETCSPPPSPSNDKENGDISNALQVPVKKFYDVECEEPGECFEDLSADSMSHTSKRPSRKFIALFLRANLVQSANRPSHAPLEVKGKLVKRYDIQDKIKDFAKKYDCNPHPLSTLQDENKSSPKPPKPESQNKKAHKAPSPDGKGKQKKEKVDPLQRSLDYFRVKQSTLDAFTSKSPGQVKPLSDEVNETGSSAEIYSRTILARDTGAVIILDKCSNKSPVKVTKPSQSIEITDRTVIVLDKCPPDSPVKVKKISKSTKDTTSFSRESGDAKWKSTKTPKDGSKTKKKGKMPIVVIDKCPVMPMESPVKVTHIEKSLAEVTVECSSSESDSAVEKCKKKFSLKPKLAKKDNAVLKYPSEKISTKEPSTKKAKERDSTDIERLGKDQVKNNSMMTEIIEIISNSEDLSKDKAIGTENSTQTFSTDEHGSSPLKCQRVEVQTPKKKVQEEDVIVCSPGRVKSNKLGKRKPEDENVKCPSSGLKQATLLDMPRNIPDNVEGVKKKQKTLSEMFKSAVDKGQPRQLSHVINKALGENMTSPSALHVHIPTPAKDLVRNKWDKMKEKRQWNLLTDEQKEQIRLENRRIKKQERMERLRLEREEKEKKRLEALKRFEDTDLELTPLPEGRAVLIPDGLTPECFADVVMLVEFIVAYKELLVPEEKVHITADALMNALVSGEDGFPVLSNVLVILLRTLLQDLQGEKRVCFSHLGIRLSDLPLTPHSAADLTRLYVQSRAADMSWKACHLDYDQQVLDIASTLENKEFFTLGPQEKLKVLVALCHDVLSSDALDNFLEDSMDSVSGIRKEKVDEQRKAKKERDLKKQKQKEEKEALESANKEAGAKGGNVEKHTTIVEALTNEQQALSEEGEIDGQGEKGEPDNELALTVKSRRMQIELNQQERERKLKEDQERRLKLEEERKKELLEDKRQATIENLHRSMRKTPLGYDRYHRRYWLFDGAVNGLFVEDGWMRRDEMVPRTDQENTVPRTDQEDMASKTDQEEMVPNNDQDDIAPLTDQEEMVPRTDQQDMISAIVKQDVKPGSVHENLESGSVHGDAQSSVETRNDVSSTANSPLQTQEMKEEAENDKILEMMEVLEETGDEPEIPKPQGPDISKILRNVPYSWSYYDDLSDICAVKAALAPRGERESKLHDALEETGDLIAKALKRGANVIPTEPTTGGDMLALLKEEVLDITDRMMRGNLGEISNMERFTQQVEKANKMGQFLVRLQQGVYPRFLKGIFDKQEDVEGPTKGAVEWKEAVRGAATLSRLHLLLGILESAIVWDLSAENVKCKICRRKSRDGSETLLLCDECNLGYHLFCLRPALDKVPKGSWSCPACKPIARRGRGNQSYKEDDDESDDEEEESSDDEEVHEDEEESEDEEEDGHEDYCHICQEGGDELICCDTCPRVYHRECHQPPLRNVPRGEWSCTECRNPRKKPSKRTAKQETKKSKTRYSSPESSSDKSESSSDKSGPSRGSATQRNKKKRSVSPCESDEEEETRKTQSRGKRSRKSIEFEDEDVIPSKARKVTRERATSNSRKRRAVVSEAKVSKDEEEERRKASSTKGTKRSEPSKPQATIPNASKRRRTNPELETCEVILTELMREEDSWPFLEPVNLKEVPDYVELVSEPMDLGTIKDHLCVLKYEDAEGFIRDVRLVFSNCDKYNHITTDVGQAGERLNKVFSKLVKEHLPRLAKPPRKTRK